MGTDERPEPNAESGPSTSPARGDIVDTFWDIPPISFDENDGGIAQGDNGTDCCGWRSVRLPQL